MKDIIKLGSILFLITAICAGLLGGIYQTTRPIITKQQEMKKEASMKRLMPEADAFIKMSNIEEVGIKEVYIATQKETYLGAIVQTAIEGYGGPIEILVGVDAEGLITLAEILTHAETPGLGANAQDETFMGQYTQKLAPFKVSKQKKAENEIEALTGATITSQAVTDGINLAATLVASYEEAWKAGEYNE